MIRERGVRDHESKKEREQATGHCIRKKPLMGKMRGPDYCKLLQVAKLKV